MSSWIIATALLSVALVTVIVGSNHFIRSLVKLWVEKRDFELFLRDVVFDCINSYKRDEISNIDRLIRERLDRKEVIQQIVESVNSLQLKRGGE